MSRDQYDRPRRGVSFPAALERRLILKFGEFELDDGLCELRRGGTRVEVRPKSLDLLLYLARNRERVVPKRELLEQVWPGVVVSEGALTTTMNLARAVVEDGGERQRVIKTVSRRGYRFVADVAEAPATAVGASEDFVGREDALAHLWSAFESARAGTGGVALVAGEAGIGKTRTASELTRTARAAGARVLSGWCAEDEGAPAYWPWVQVLRGLEHDPARLKLPHAWRDELVRLLPEAAAKPRELGDDGPEARFRLYEAVAGLLRGAAERAPLVVLLDDLHWADASSLRLLVFAARELRDSRVLLLGTYRQDEAPTPALAELAREPRHQRLVLTGLSRSEVARLVERIARIEPEAALVDAIHERTDGNPFFVRELARMLAAEGRLAGSEGRDAWRSAIPLAVSDVIARRLARLAPETRELLGIAAVIGRDFAVEVLERASERPREAVAHALADAERSREIRLHPSDARSYRFAHALIQDVLRESVGTARQRALHRKVAEALESELAERVDPPLAEIARHWCLGAGPADAARLAEACLRAARSAFERLAYEETAELCRRGLAELDTLGVPLPEARCELLALRARALYFAGTAEWRAVVDEAVAMARRIGAPHRIAEIAMDISIVETGVVDAQRVALLEEALAAARDEALRAQLLAGLANALYWSPRDAQRVRALADEALALARKLGRPDLLARILNHRHTAVWGPDSLAERATIAKEVIELAQRNRLGYALYIGLFNDLLNSLESGDGAAARLDIAAISRIGSELGNLSESPPTAALHALLDGRLDDAEKLARARFESAERGGIPNSAMFYAVQLASVRREQGRLGELELGLRALRAQIPSMPSWSASLAYLYAADERNAEARMELEALANGLDAVPRDANWLVTVGLFAETAALLGDEAHARTTGALLVPYAERVIVIGSALTVLSSVARTLALVHATCGEPAEARRAFERALVIEERVGARCLVTRTRAEYAELLTASDRAGDRDRARALAAAALADAESIGMAKVAARARALLERLSGVIPLRGRRQERESG